MLTAGGLESEKSYLNQSEIMVEDQEGQFLWDITKSAMNEKRGLAIASKVGHNLVVKPGGESINEKKVKST
ncbi:MAG: hypothetical protein JXA42_15020 [Anaerolineales bacterium]|nr:hypothetical protein [Anaerolineales bacterium]